LRIALALLLLSSTALASEPDLFGLGPRSGAMAGTGVADADDWEATYLNPAGLVEARHRRLTLGYTGARYRLTLDGMHRKVDQTNGVVLGAVLPLPFGGVLSNRLAIGLGFYFPTGLITRAQDGFPDEPRLALLDNRTQVVSLLVAGSARIHRRITVGAGVLALAALVGEINIRPDASGKFTTVAEEQLVSGFAPILGVRVLAADWARVGFAYRGQSTSGYDIAVKNSLGTSIPIQLPTIHIAGTAQFDPHQIAVEGAFDATRWLRLVGGVTWKHWSSYSYPVENATPGAPPKPPADIHDTAVPRLAGEATGHFGHLTLQGRLGYFFEWSPAPDGPDRVLLDADRHVLSAGGGLSYGGRSFAFRVDGFAQWHHLVGTRASGDLAVFGGTVGVDL
jgi:long-chain fatty acid transport protein